MNCNESDQISAYCVPYFYYSHLVAQTVKRLPTMRETRLQSLGQEDPLEKEMATHFSILAWKIPRKEEPGRLQSVCGVAKSRTQVSNYTFTFISVTITSAPLEIIRH